MQQKIIAITGYALLTGILLFSLNGVGQSLASEGYRGEEHDLDHEYNEEYEHNNRRVSFEQNSAYVEECGSCHMAYPASLLPAASWEKIMLGLENHFGESAELDEDTSRAIENFLVRSSGEGSYQKLFRNLGDETPLRITELPYFVHEHDEIPARFVTGNEQVGSLGQCNACHRSAERGIFDEDDVFIAGVGRWDD